MVMLLTSEDQVGVGVSQMAGHYIRKAREREDPKTYRPGDLAFNVYVQSPFFINVMIGDYEGEWPEYPMSVLSYGFEGSPSEMRETVLKKLNELGLKEIGN